MSKPLASLGAPHSSVKSYALPSNFLAGSPECRMDAGYYNPEFLAAVTRLRNSGMQTERLADIATKVFIPPRFKRIYVEPEYGVPFLQGSHIVHFQPADVKYLSRTYHKLEKWIIREGWILVTCSGTIGRTTICPKEWNKWAASQHILRVIPDEKKCPSGYLCAFLASPLGQVQLTANIYGAVVDELTEEQAESIVVPVPRTEEDKQMMYTVDKAMKKAVKMKSVAVASARASIKELTAKFEGPRRERQRATQSNFQANELVTNPYYEGATPEMVGRALLKHQEPRGDDGKAEGE